jgi:hypothetical protein
MLARSALSFPKGPAVFDQRLPEYDQGHESRQHKRCKTHLNKHETGRIFFAKKPTCHNAANSQKLVSGPSEPIKYIALRRHAVTSACLKWRSCKTKASILIWSNDDGKGLNSSLICYASSKQTGTKPLLIGPDDPPIYLREP